MEAARFWSLIDEARKPTGLKPKDPSADPENLKALLTPLSDAEVTEFSTFMYERLCDLNQWNLWGAGYVINGGMGDDSFHYFRTWIIGKGKAAYEAALSNPETLGDFVDDDDDLDNELLEYVPIDILEGRGIEDDPRDASERGADDEPSGTWFDEETVHQLFPRLSARFG